MPAEPPTSLIRATAALALATLAVAAPASAQVSQFPGMGGGVTVTTTGPAAAPPPAAAAPAAPAKKAAAPVKSKPKPTTTASVDGAPVKAGQAIIMLVNDEPITAYELDMRSRFMSMSSNVGATAQENFKRLATSEDTNKKMQAILEQTLKENQGKPREQIVAIFEKRKLEFAQNLQRQALDSARAGLAPKFRKEAQEELIEEKLKLQEARRLSVELAEDELNRVMKGLAERNKLTEAQFAQNIKNMGSDVSVLRARFAANLAWRDVIRRKFSAQISINQRDVERFLEKNPAGGGEDTVELGVQKITIALPAKLDQASLAQRLADADGLRRKFSGCKTTGTLAATLPGAKFDDLKTIKPSSVTEPTRSFLLSAKEGEMLPPQTNAAGIEVYALCSRKAIKTDDKKREEAQQELASREFEQLAKRHLRDLRQDAHIEYR